MTTDIYMHCMLLFSFKDLIDLHYLQNLINLFGHINNCIKLHIFASLGLLDIG